MSSQKPRAEVCEFCVKFPAFKIRLASWFRIIVTFVNLRVVF